MNRDEIIDLGKAAERLFSHKDFKTIWDAYTLGMVLEATERFEGSSEQVETLKSIAHFKMWFLQLMDDAKILTKDN